MMTPATERRADGRLLEVNPQGRLTAHRATALASLFRPGDLLVANDAATLPASLSGHRAHDGAPLELRLAARRCGVAGLLDRGAGGAPCDGDAGHGSTPPIVFDAVLFGDGDHRTPTEQRPPPPPLQPGERLILGPLQATVWATLGHPRLLRVAFDGGPPAFWSGLAAHGRPVQYAYLTRPLALWDTWTAFAGPPVAVEAPSAAYALDWATLTRLLGRGVGFATLTHAAGLSSTGDASLDARLPLDEPYHLPQATVEAIERTRRRGGRVVALGTTVVRALEHAAGRQMAADLLPAGHGLADQRLGPGSPLRVVDAMLTGTHEPGSSHHTLLQAFVSSGTLAAIDAELARGGWRSHEFGDHLWISLDAALRPAGRGDALSAAPQSGRSMPSVRIQASVSANSMSSGVST